MIYLVFYISSLNDPSRLPKTPLRSSDPTGLSTHNVVVILFTPFLTLYVIDITEKPDLKDLPLKIKNPAASFLFDSTSPQPASLTRLAMDTDNTPIRSAMRAVDGSAFGHKKGRRALDTPGMRNVPSTGSLSYTDVSSSKSALVSPIQALRAPSLQSKETRDSTLGSLHLNPLITDHLEDLEADLDYQQELHLQFSNKSTTTKISQLPSQASVADKHNTADLDISGALFHLNVYESRETITQYLAAAYSLGQMPSERLVILRCPVVYCILRRIIVIPVLRSYALLYVSLMICLSLPLYMYICEYIPYIATLGGHQTWVRPYWSGRSAPRTGERRSACTYTYTVLTIHTYIYHI